MGALLAYLSGFKHIDMIGLFDRAQAMGHDERGFIAQEVAQRGVQAVFRLRVQGRGGLVEDDNGRLAEHHARDRQPLPLPARQPDALAAHDAFQFVRQCLYRCF